MRGVEAFFSGALVLIALYLLLTKGGADLIRGIATGTSSIFKTLQGRG